MTTDCNDNPKSMGLIAQVARGLLAHGSRATESRLGDRSLYVGMSDIGRAAECMRAAVAGKAEAQRDPESADVTRWFEQGRYGEIRDALERQLVLQRGHWFEDGIVQAFAANGAQLFSQLEIEAEAGGVPIRAHLDLVLARGAPRPAVRVLEIKSTERLPETLYAGYEIQLYGQLGLLATLWNTPSFSLRDPDGRFLHRKLTFPGIARLHLGVELPDSPAAVDVEGWVLAVSMSGAKAFGPYTPDATALDHCMRLASELWRQAGEIRAGRLGLDQVDHCRGFHPLCDWCRFQAGCPKFACQPLADASCDRLFAELEGLKRQKSEAETGIAEREQRLRGFYRSSGADGWLSAGGWRFRCQEVAGRKSLDTSALLAAIAEALGDEAASQMVEQCTKQGSSYQRLCVGKVAGEG